MHCIRLPFYLLNCCILDNINGRYSRENYPSSYHSPHQVTLCSFIQDVISLRKRSGTISGEVRLNGWLQDPVSFRRCSGYVEQFDVQSPELTVRETVLFSARLRLDPLIVDTDEKKQAFVDHILEEVELTVLASELVGTDESGGLSFEQKKRLSIAVELAASPSLLFLDEVRCSRLLFKRTWVFLPFFLVSVFCYSHSPPVVWTLGVQNWSLKHFERLRMVIALSALRFTNPLLSFLECL